MKHARVIGLFVSLSLVLPSVVTGAGLFVDVSESHSFKGEIEALARMGILKGNPDGNFYPDRSVNRAEFLKMLYVATNRIPKPIYAGCFADVEAGSWYESFVCDAASPEHRFVQGYSDGKFRPSAPVSRTEALKMIFMLFGLDTPDISLSDKDVIKFVDISTAAWYSKYISAAYIKGILPIAGQAGARFYPDQPLLRGEASAYIFNAQRALDKENATAAESSSATSASSVSSQTSGRSSSSSSTAAVIDVIKNVIFPFTDTGLFQAKRPSAYLFKLTAKTNVWAQVTVSGYYQSAVTCRLYLLGADGFTDEYYLGFQQGSTCTIKVAAKPGSYQLQVQPAVQNIPYTVVTKTDTGDGNDSFSEAVQLLSNLSHTDILGAGDLFDWYTFTITKQQTATFEVSAADKLNCIIYTPPSVDQYGFKGPECGKPYMFEPGAEGSVQYTVGIGRQSGDSIRKVPYTVKLH